MFFIEFPLLGRGSWRELLLQLVEGLLGDHEVRAVQHVVDVDLRGVDHLQAGDVAAGEQERTVGLVLHEQRLALHAQPVQKALQDLGLGLLDAEAVDDPQAPVVVAPRQRRAQGGDARLLRHRVRVVARGRPEDGAAVPPERRADVARPPPAGALLAPGLAARAGDEGPVLRHVRAAARVGAILLDRLVEQVLVDGDREDLGSQRVLAELAVVAVYDGHRAFRRTVDDRRGPLLLRVPGGALRLGLLAGRLRLLARRRSRGRLVGGGLAGRGLARGLRLRLARLRRRRLLLLDHAPLSLPDDHVSAAGAGHRAPDDESVLSRVDADDGQVLGRDALVAHVPRPPQPLDDARGIRRGADAAGRAMEHGAVGGIAAAEVVALHHPLEPLALAHPYHLHDVAGREQVHRDLVAHLVLGPVVDTELPEDAARGQPRLVEVAFHGLRDPLDLAVLHEAELHRRVAVLRLRLALDDDAGPRLDDGDGDRPPVLRIHLGHADLLPDDSLDGHYQLPLDAEAAEDSPRPQRTRTEFKVLTRPRLPQSISFMLCGLCAISAASASTPLNRRLLRVLLAEGLDLHVHARGQVQLHERVHRLGSGLENVEQPLVGADLELLPALLVHVRRAVDRPAVRD